MGGRRRRPPPRSRRHTGRHRASRHRRERDADPRGRRADERPAVDPRCGGPRRSSRRRRADRDPLQRGVGGLGSRRRRGRREHRHPRRESGARPRAARRPSRRRLGLAGRGGAPSRLEDRRRRRPRRGLVPVGVVRLPRRHGSGGGRPPRLGPLGDGERPALGFIRLRPPRVRGVFLLRNGPAEPAGDDGGPYRRRGGDALARRMDADPFRLVAWAPRRLRPRSVEPLPLREPLRHEPRSGAALGAARVSRRDSRRRHRGGGDSVDSTVLGSHSRRHGAVFLEMGRPFDGDAPAAGGFRIGLRGDDTSDFGSRFTPHAGLFVAVAAPPDPPRFRRDGLPGPDLHGALTIAIRRTRAIRPSRRRARRTSRRGSAGPRGDGRSTSSASTATGRT